MNRALKLAGLATAAGILLAACGSSNNSPTSASGNGMLSVQMTDAATDEVTSINVYVTGLMIKPKNGAVQRISNSVGLIDILTLQGTTKQLVDLGVPAGDYEFVQVELDQTRSNVIVKAGGAIEPLQIPSQEIKVLGGFTVPDGGSTTVTLDFKAAPSLQHLGNGGWLLTPVIVQVSP